MEKNIADFSRFTAMLMERLYGNFPNPVVISVDDMDERADRETIRTYISTVEFLSQEGLIRYKSATIDSVFHDVQLTAKGLTLLDSISADSSCKKSLITLLREALKEGSKVAVKTVVEAILRGSL